MTSPVSGLRAGLPKREELINLATLQIGAAEIRVFTELLAHPGSTLVELERQLGIGQEALVQILDTLQREALAVAVTPTRAAEDSAHLDLPDKRWEARQPQDDLDAILVAHQQRVEQLRESHRIVRSLNEIYWRRREVAHYEGLEVVYDPAQVLDLVTRIQGQAAVQIRAFMRPPYYARTNPDRIRSDSDLQARRMAEGIQYRAVWESSVWDDPVTTKALLDAIRAGEQARLMPTLPMKLYLIDDQRAVMPLDPARHSDRATLIVHPSGLLAALGNIFEFFWDLAVPMNASSDAAITGELSGRERDVLMLLASGANVDSISRRLSLSRSTVTRTVAMLENRLGVVSPFQLGAEAARRGYI